MTQSSSTISTSYYSATTLKWLALLALLFTALVSYNNQSTRGDETGGSGIGGTGRSGEPGSESGLGGTGFRPFIGSNTSGASRDGSDASVIQPQVVLRPDSTIAPLSATLELATESSIPPPDMPVPRVIEIVQPAAMTRDSAPIDINEQIQRNLDRRAVGHLSMRMSGTYAMNIFGKPSRTSNCDCERTDQTSMLQSIFFMNDPLVSQRLRDSAWIRETAESARGMSREKQAAQHPSWIREAFLRVLNRPPTQANQERTKNHLVEASTIEQGLQDLLWALLNTKEFLMNH